jgi:uncharacterized coiled-coil protein SlyX
MRKFVVLVVVALGLLLLAPTAASASTPSLKSLAKAVKALQKTERSQAATIKSLKSKVATQASAITSLQGKVTTQASKITGLQTTVAGQATTLHDAARLLAIAPYVSLDKGVEYGVKGPNIVFQGANVHVRSTTDEGDASATGNLIIGWDAEPLTLPSTLRTGANNLVVGAGNNFTSFGCLVAGGQNTTSAPYASVSGGAANTADNAYTSVAGGADNTAESTGATISGGEGIWLDSGSPYAWQGGTYQTP